MIVVGLLAHGAPPASVPELHGVARLAVAVNAQSAPVPTRWLGFGANHNRLMNEFPDAEWYVALNADVQLSAEQLYRLVDEATRHDYGLVSPLRREPWGAQGGASESLPTPAYFLKTTFVPGRLANWRAEDPIRSGSIVQTTWIGGACMAIRGDLMRQVRFDERYFMYFEDVDLSQRAADLGARVGVCTAVTVDHAVGWNPGDPLVGRRGVEYARSAIVYAEAHGYSRHTMRAAALAHSSVRIALGKRPPAARAASRAVARGLISPSNPGLSELASAHNARHGLRPELS